MFSCVFGISDFGSPLFFRYRFGSNNNLDLEASDFASWVSASIIPAEASGKLATQRPLAVT